MLKEFITLTLPWQIFLTHNYFLGTAGEAKEANILLEVQIMTILQQEIEEEEHYHQYCQRKHLQYLQLWVSLYYYL